MHLNIMAAASDNNAGGVWGSSISTAGTVIVALLTYLAARSTTRHDRRKPILAGDYKLKRIDLPAQVTWKPVSDEAWAHQLKRMQWLRVVLPVIFFAAFAAAQWSFLRGTSRPINSPLIVVLLVVAGLTEFGWIMNNRAMQLRADKTAAEAGTSDLQLVIEGKQDAVLSSCIAGMRKIGHAIASVDVQASVAGIVSVGDYGQERLRVVMTEVSTGEHRLNISAERRPSFTSSHKTRRCVLRLVEQLTGYRLYTSPPQRRQETLDSKEAASEESAPGTPAIESE